MVEALIKLAILVVVLVIIFFVVTWALGTVGVVIPQFIVVGIVAIMVLIGCLWLWRNRGSLGL